MKYRTLITDSGWDMSEAATDCRETVTLLAYAGIDNLKTLRVWQSNHED